MNRTIMNNHMLYPFFKAHGLGNDYIFFDFTEIAPAQIAEVDWSAVSRRLSARHTGIGGDGIVLILPSKVADAAMRIFNADGSEAQMCGNAARCVGRYLGHDLTLETRAGVRAITVTDTLITVDMGEVTYNGQWNEYHLWSVGNPHAVRFIQSSEISSQCSEVNNLVWTEGPRVEKDPHFPERTNVEFAHILSSHEIFMRVWERGSGETMACGTGATATAHAAVHEGLCEWPVTVHLLGGELVIDRQLMSGEAQIVYYGEAEI